MGSEKITSACIAIVLCASLYSAGCSYSGDPRLSESDLRYYVRFLASDNLQGREAGSEYGKVAGNFLAGQLRQAGLHPAFQGSFFQDFNFDAGIRIPAERNYLIWQSKSSGKRIGERLETHRIDLQPLPFARPGHFEGSLLFLGFCLDDREEKYDDFKGVDLRDRAVLCLRYGPGGEQRARHRRSRSFQAKYRAARKRGAGAVVFLKSPGSPEINSEMVPPRDVSGPPAVFIRSDFFYRSYPFLKTEEVKLLKGGRSDQRGQVMGKVTIETDFHPDPRIGRNTGGYLRRPRKGEELLVVGAHYDHIGRGYFSSLEGPGKIHNGADDNASGAAVVLELAAEFARLLREDPDRIPPRVNILFMFFDAEERGLVGSRFFVKSKYFSKERTGFMINLDMVGRLRDKRGLYIQGVETADMRLRRIVKSDFGQGLFPPAIRLNLIPGGHGPGDHSSFYGRGIPVLFIHTGFHPQYHTSADDTDRINFRGMVDVARFCKRLLLEIATLDRRLEFRKAREGKYGYHRRKPRGH